MTKRILSGIQPTGNLHLGNYLGAIKNWVALQKDYECLFCVVDLHAITVPQDPHHLIQSTRETVATYLACGISAEEASIFPQSMVAEHTELMWILACHTPLGWLNRMTQFKEKAGKQKDQASMGLYAYPVLMAADILLYQATDVPVGEDQKQHLELARDIAGAFNRHYNTTLLTLPEPRIMGAATRVMSLRDGSNKMSKSDSSDASRIHLKDSDDVIFKKIQKARTDSGAFPSSEKELEGRLEVQNLLNIYLSLSGQNIQDVYQEFGGRNFSDFKTCLAEVCVEQLRPIREKIVDLMDNKDYLDTIIQKGTGKARTIAQGTMRDVKRLVGLFQP
jgi:tryptophanyl-tRNA synthetase